MAQFSTKTSRPRASSADSGGGGGGVESGAEVVAVPTAAGVCEAFWLLPHPLEKMNVARPAAHAATAQIRTSVLMLILPGASRPQENTFRSECPPRGI
jgi:hypothetical protein